MGATVTFPNECKKIQPNLVPFRRIVQRHTKTLFLWKRQAAERRLGRLAPLKGELARRSRD